jgi:hypothetical protein
LSNILASKEFKKNAEKIGRPYTFATAAEAKKIVDANLKILLTYKAVLKKYMAPR